MEPQHSSRSNSIRAGISPGLVIGLGAFAAIILFVIIVACIMIDYSNKDTGLRNAIAAKQRDNQSELDNMQKKIMQSASITQEQASYVKDLIVGNSSARSTGSGSLVTAVREAVPNVDISTFKQLMNIVTSSRDSFTMRQKEILDMKREEDNLRTMFPSSLVVGGRPEIQVTIVTSDRAEEAFRAGKDNDTDLFNKKKQ